MNTHSHRFHNKMYLIKQKIPVSRGDNWLKIHQKSKYVNELMTLCCQKVTKQGKMCGFLTTIIENSAFVIFTRYEKFFSRSWYHKATAPISTIIFTLCPSWRNVMELIQNWYIKISRPKAFKCCKTCPKWTTRTTKPLSSNLPPHNFLISTNQLTVLLTKCWIANQVLTLFSIRVIWNSQHMKCVTLWWWIKHHHWEDHRHIITIILYYIICLWGRQTSLWTLPISCDTYM